MSPPPPIECKFHKEKAMLRRGSSHSEIPKTYFGKNPATSCELQNNTISFGKAPLHVKKNTLRDLLGWDSDVGDLDKESALQPSIMCWCWNILPGWFQCEHTGDLSNGWESWKGGGGKTTKTPPKGSPPEWTATLLHTHQFSLPNSPDSAF